MKKTRLLELIREEIDTAINEIPDIAKDSDLLKEIEQLAEMASMKQLKDQLEKQNMDSELKAVKAAEKSTIDKLSKDPVFSGTGKDQRLKGYVKNLKKELKDTHDIKLQDLLKDVEEGATKRGDDFNDTISINTIEKNAAKKVLGTTPPKETPKSDSKKEKEEEKKEPKAKSEPKAEPKPKTKAKPEPKTKARKKSEDEEKAEETANTDSTAKDLAKQTDVELAKQKKKEAVKDFTDKMKEIGVVGDDNKILDTKKYKEEFAKVKAKF